MDPAHNALAKAYKAEIDFVSRTLGGLKENDSIEAYSKYVKEVWPKMEKLKKAMALYDGINATSLSIVEVDPFIKSVSSSLDEAIDEYEKLMKIMEEALVAD